MSCLFCSSKTHVSQNCDKYISDVSRKLSPSLKDRCHECLSFVKEAESKLNCLKCKYYRKCYICFTIDHHTVYCSQRSKVSNSSKFLPKIDIQLINLEEKYSLAFSIPEVLKNTQIMPLQLIEVLEKYDFHGLSWIKKNVKEQISLSKTTENVNLDHIFLSAKEFLLLLCFTTKKLDCTHVKLTSKLEFPEIIEKIPKIQELHIFDTNITIEKTWPQDLLKWLNAKELRNLRISVNDFDFDVGALATFIKKKCPNYSILRIIIDSSA